MDDTEKLILGGAIAAGLIETGLEALFKSDPARWTDTFPFIGLPHPLPPLDDVLVAAGSAAVYFYGNRKREEDKEMLGLGMMAYSVPYVLHAVILNLQAGP